MYLGVTYIVHVTYHLGECLDAERRLEQPYNAEELQHSQGNCKGQENRSCAKVTCMDESLGKRLIANDRDLDRGHVGKYVEDIDLHL